MSAYNSEAFLAADCRANRSAVIATLAGKKTSIHGFFFRCRFLSDIDILRETKGENGVCKQESSESEKSRKDRKESQQAKTNKRAPKHNACRFSQMYSKVEETQKARVRKFLTNSESLTVKDK